MLVCTQMRDDAPRCWSCTSPLDGDQRYCLECGSPVVDVARALAPAAPAPEDTARPAPTSARAAIPRRGAAAALAGAVAIGVLAGISSSPASIPARRVVVAAAPVVQPVAGAPAASSAGGLASLQAPVPGAPATVALEPAAPAAQSSAPAPAATSTPTPKSKPKAPADKPAAAKDKKQQTPAAEPPPKPPVKHVVVVALADAGIREAFGAGTPMPYLARELRVQGALLRGYHAIAHGDLPNLLGLLTGQAGNPATDAGCPALTPFVASGRPDPDGQLPGAGCVLGADAPSLPAQLDEAKLGWRAYVEGADPPPDVPPAPCTPPAPAPDGTPTSVERNPLLFLAGVTAAPDCTARVTGLGGLTAQLALPAAEAPALTLVVPDACHAGRDGACPAGEPAGLARADQWLREWIPQIVAAPAFADDGLLVITFAQARATGKLADSASCCGQPTAINEPRNPDPQAPVAGGGRVGALVLSPHVKPASASDTPYNHLALLRTIEDAFGLEHLGLAAATDLRPLGDDVFLPAR
jgi:hypothetical protein